MDNNILGMGALLAGAGTAAWGLVSSLKGVPKFFYTKIRNRLVYTVRVYQYDALFEILEDWISTNHQKIYRDVEVELKTTTKNKVVRNGRGISYWSNEKIPGKELKYKQEDNTSIVKFRGKTLFINKSKEKLDKAQSLREVYFRKYTISGWMAKEKIHDLLQDAVTLSNKKKPKDMVEVLRNSAYGEWVDAGKKRVKPLEKVVLAPTIKSFLLNDIDEFTENEDWYADASIPYKRGYCFYGPPGTGKTTLALAMASYTGREVHVLNLNSMEDDSKMAGLMSGISDNAILLIEDIDKIFVGRENAKEGSKITFSSFLNCMDGAFYKHGVITIITTNHIEKLDEALLRTGRIDLKMEIPLPTDREISEYLSIFFATPIQILGKFSLKMSDVQEICICNKNSAEEAKKQIYSHQKLNGKHENRKQVPNEGAYIPQN